MVYHVCLKMQFSQQTNFCPCRVNRMKRQCYYRSAQAVVAKEPHWAHPKLVPYVFYHEAFPLKDETDIACNFTRNGTPW